MQNKNLRLLTSDTSAGNGPEIDPLAMPAGDVDTSIPRLREGNYELIIRDAQRKDNEEKKTQAISFKLELTQEAFAQDDTKLHAGFKFMQRLNGASGKRDNAAWQKDLATLIKCAFGNEGAKNVTLRQIWDNPSLLDGKIVKAKVVLRPAKDGFAESNEARFVPPPISAT